MMKKLLIMVFVLGFFFVTPRFTFAHLLKTDGSIGAVLHIDPEDDPIVGKQSGFFFEIKDKAGKFDPTSCDCTFHIMQGGKELVSQQVTQTNQTNQTTTSVFYTFPERNVYQVALSGKPIGQASFQPFYLVWDVRVSRIATEVNNSSPSTFVQWFVTHIVHVIGVGVILIFFVVTVVKDQQNRR